MLLGAEHKQTPMPHPEDQNALAQPPSASIDIPAPCLWHQGPPGLARGRQLAEALGTLKLGWNSCCQCVCGGGLFP